MSRSLASGGTRIPSTQLDTTAAAASVESVRQRSSSAASRELLDSSIGERAIQADPKARKEWQKFAQSVDRTLQSFESVSEWADFITFLGKLLKCLQAYPAFAYVPHKLVVAKRLAQCLNPALPTGVHQRALDVYVHILSGIGPDNLRRDLQLWSSGLFPFFQYAATSVRPIVLGIYSKFYIPLQEALRPATKAMILALLPGLEEEGGEFFEKVSSLLDQLSGTVSPSFFLQNIWLVLITAPSLRIAALNYLGRRMPKIGKDDSIGAIVGDDVGLMVRGFSAALEDGQILVQRAALDLVIATLPTDGTGFQKDTRRKEQLFLMRAMTGVVLRRDLSLSRRLYSWLLGSAEDSDSQVEHLRKNGLALLREALVEDIDDPEVDPGDLVRKQRPYKVVLSLLDKWEISFPLTEVIVLDLLRALHRSLNNGELHDELLITVTTLFDGLDPYLSWRQLFIAAHSQLKLEAGAATDALDLIAFVLHAFRLTEDEVIKLHAPMMAFSLFDRVNEVVAAQQYSHEDAVLAVHLGQALLKETSPTFFSTTEREDATADNRLCGISIAEEFYSSSDDKSARVPTTGFAARLVKNGFLSLLDLVKSSLASANSPDEDLLLASLRTLSFLAEHPSRDRPVDLPWEPKGWLAALLGNIATTGNSMVSRSFDAVEAAIQCMLALNAAPIRPALVLDKRSTMATLIDLLLGFLQPSSAPYHVQAVALVWAVQDLSSSKHVEAAICQKLASPDPVTQQRAYEAFGNLWRFTEDSVLPGVKLAVPVRMMLDALRSENLRVRHSGEAWMRCSLKSYIRVLEPLLHALLDPKVRRKAETISVEGVDLHIEQYQHVFDMAQHQHVLDNLISLASFGGQGFTRLAKTTFFDQSPYPDLRQRAQSSHIANDNYLDALCKILVKMLSSEAAPFLAGAIDAPNQYIYAATADLLQSLVSRGDVELQSLQAIENALVTRLFLCIHREEYDLQNKFLHVLHSTIAAINTAQKRKDRRSTVGEKSAGSASLPAPIRTSLDRSLGGHDPLLVMLMSDGITKQRNGAIVHHWVDFLLMTLPHLRTSLSALLFPLIDRIGLRLRTFVDEMEMAYDPTRKGKGKAVSSHSADVSDADFAVLLNALERLFAIAVDEAKTANTQEDNSLGTERPTTADGHSGGGFLGYISTALGTADGHQAHPDTAPKAKPLINVKLGEFVRLLLQVWNVSSRLESLCDADESISQGYLSMHVRLRTKKAFERLYKSNASDVLEGMVELWHERHLADAQDTLDQQDRLFEMLNHLAPSAQSVVSMLVDLISAQHGSDKGKVTPVVPTSYETVRFEFLEAYMARLDGPIAVQVWPSIYNFCKDFVNAPALHKYRLLPALRCLTTLVEKISQTSALEDRRMRRDVHETFIKLVDATIQMSGRSGAGLQRPAASASAESAATTPMLTDTDGQDKALDGSLFSEKITQSQILHAHSHQDSAKELATFLAQRVVPDFRRFTIDSDKLAATCGNIIYYNVSPAFKTRGRTFEIDESILHLLAELTKVPAAFKAWRSQVLEAFSDNRFFYGPPSNAGKWRAIVQALVASDKERFPDLIAKISAASSANIFVNRELESLSKAISIRRLSYTIFCGEKNRYLVQLPAIQEKVVELLRAQVSDLVHSEVYLCLRVLLCRIGNQHLSSFWPIILTELLRLYEQLMSEPSASSGEYLQLILSACKFLDLLLVLQTEEFQIHQWMFITDTVDAVYPPESWSPQATMDRLGELLNRRPDLLRNVKSSQRAQADDGHGLANGGKEVAASGTGKGGNPLARPILGASRQSKIASLAELEPFFSRASLVNYEAVYAMGGVDWAAVEHSLELDLFEGDE